MTADGVVGDHVPDEDVPGGAADGARVLRRLLAGNERFAARRGRARGPRPDLADAQSPVAVVLACADSRVAPEVVLDQDLGDLFTVRVGGNTAQDPTVLGSIEFAVAVVGVPLLLVLGHDGCGAMMSALDVLDGGPPPPGHVAALVEPLLGAAGTVGDAPRDGRLGLAVREHVRHQVGTLASSAPVLAPAVAAGRLLVAGGCYSLAAGTVELVSPTASP